ncbi:MAG: glycosyltransferase family 4 protein [Desulfomicrobium sp.]|nr:glycosyltransferase family 4 protein [Desulfomicrobium sp.]
MKKLLFLNYLIWKPDDPGFRHRFEQLSKYYSGSILHLGTGKVVAAGKFRFCSIRWKENIVRRQLGYLWFCCRNAKKNGPVDAIVSYDPMICGVAGVLVKAITKAKLLVEINTDHFDQLPGRDQSIKSRIVDRIKKGCVRLTFRFADGLKFINTPLKEKYFKLFDLNERRVPVRTFFSFIGTHAFNKTGLVSNGPILCVGHPYDVKGVDVLLKAFQSISASYPDAKLKIIGHCEDRKPYEKLAAGNQNISFHKGMFFNDIVTEFENCRFLVLPSRSESMGRVLIEAMACGKAVIASRVGGIPEVVEENKTGLLFESENHSELAEKMRQFLDNPDMMQRMGDAGYHRAKDHFSPERYLELYHEFLESVDSGSARDSANVSGSCSRV